MKMMFSGKAMSVAVILAGLTGGSMALAEGDPAGHMVLAPTDLKWKPNPLVQGSEQAVLLGDPKKAGPYVMRIKFPPNFVNKPHTHPDDRVVTIISGTWNFGHGDTFDASKGKVLPQGAFFTEPANAVHYNFTKTEPVVIQIHGMGPTGTTPVKK
jgi:quercetin dioxygenase-like cupin family protein